MWRSRSASVMRVARVTSHSAGEVIVIGATLGVLAPVVTMASFHERGRERIRSFDDIFRR
jgi:hypothetical protein